MADGWSGDSDGDVIAAALARAVTDAPGRTFAVVDGAQFDDLPTLLAANGLNHRSLYLGAPDEGLMRASPFLVDPYLPPEPSADLFETDEAALNEVLRARGHDPDALDEAGLAASADLVSAQFADWLRVQDQRPAPDPSEAFARLFALVGDRPAIVLWSGAMDAGALYKHLRSINRALLPSDGDDREGADGNLAPTSYLFRHYDGRVLAEVLPVLDQGQFARLFGPARRLSFTASGYEDRHGNPVRMAELPDAVTVPPPPGSLQLDADQVRAIEERRLRAMWREIADDILAQQAAEGLPVREREMRQEIWEYIAYADRFGVESYEAFYTWSVLNFWFGGRLIGNEGIEAIMDGSLFDEPIPTPDERVEFADEYVRDLQERKANGEVGRF